MLDSENLSTQPYELKSFAKTRTLLLAIDPRMVDLNAKRAVALERGLDAKSEFHITIIGTRTGEQIQEYLAGLEESERQAEWEKVVALADSIDWEVELLDEYYYIEKEYEIEEEVSRAKGVKIERETRRSIIQMADVQRLEEFYNRLNELTGINLQPQFPTHVTLFTTSTNPVKTGRGIGIYSQREFEAMGPVRL